MIAPGRFVRGLCFALVLALPACEYVPDMPDMSRVKDAVADLPGIPGLGNEPPPLPGKRVSVLALERQLKADPSSKGREIRLPKPVANAEWPQAGGLPSHVMHHLALGDKPVEQWSVDIGAGASKGRRIPAQPVVAGGSVFVMDARAVVRAFDVTNGKQRWSVDLTPSGEDSGVTDGGVAFYQGKVFAATGYGEVVALNAADGARLWTKRIGVPVSAPPTVNVDRVFVVTFDNQLFTLDAANGEVKWTHTGLPENTVLLGGASPAADGGIVVAPFSSGELFALRVDTGAVAWTEQLLRTTRFSPVGAINDINGRPIIDRGRVLAISQSGRMVMIDIRTGQLVWDRELASIQSPWVVGDYIYVITLESEVVCLRWQDGQIQWVRQLDRFENPNSKGNKRLINWYGPVLAGDRLVALSSRGEALAISPYTGDLLGKIQLSDGVSFGPVVANGTLYVLTDDAELVAMR